MPQAPSPSLGKVAGLFEEGVAFKPARFVETLAGAIGAVAAIIGAVSALLKLFGVT